MSVSKEMAEKVMGYNQELDLDVALVVAQDVINAAWTKFVYDDQDTWPKHEGVSLVMCEQFVNPHIAVFHCGVWKCLDYKSAPEITVIEYADPQNFKSKDI